MMLGLYTSLRLFQEVPEDQPSEDVVGRPLPHLSAAKHATGEAVYCDDIPRYAGKHCFVLLPLIN